MLKTYIITSLNFIFALVKKNYLFFLLFMITSCIFSQKKYKSLLSFYNDNDLYVSVKKDRYYTNGMFLTYRYASEKKSEKSIKKIYEFQLGHKMYTPFKATVDLKGEHDRPFAAYFYGKFGINRFFKNNSSLYTSLETGVIGPSAFGSEIQDFIHDMYGYKKAIGWNYQISEAFALNFEGNYNKQLTKSSTNFFDITWSNNLRAGTVFTDFSTGLIGRIGFKPLQNIANSISYNSNLNNKNSSFYNQPEVFIFIKPMFHYVLYDATIQGSFLNTSSPITYEVVPIKLTTQIGFQFTSNRFNFGYFVNYHSKKVKNDKVATSNFYGTFVVNYLFN